MGDLPTIEMVPGGALIAGQFCPLRGQEREIFGRLARAKGGFVHHDLLIATLWPNPDREPQSAKTTLGVRVTWLRRRIKGYGIEIRAVHGQGYQLSAVSVAEQDLDDVDRLALLIGAPDWAVERLLREGRLTAGAVLARLKVRLGRAGGGA